MNIRDPSRWVQQQSSVSLPNAICHRIHRLSFLTRPCSGITKRPSARLTAEKSEISVPVSIEGPYGQTSIAVCAADTILAFADGVGIIGILGHLHTSVKLVGSPYSMSSVRAIHPVLARPVQG